MTAQRRQGAVGRAERPLTCHVDEVDVNLFSNGTVAGRPATTAYDDEKTEQSVTFNNTGEDYK